MFPLRLGRFYECNDAPVSDKEDCSMNSKSSKYEDNNREGNETKAEEVVLLTNIFLTTELSQDDFPLLHSIDLLKLMVGNGVIV